MSLFRKYTTIKNFSINEFKRISTQLKFISSPVTKKKLFNRPPNKDWEIALIKMRKEGFTEIPSLLDQKIIKKINEIECKNLLENFEKGKLPGIYPLDFSKKMEYGTGLCSYDVDYSSPILNNIFFWNAFEWLAECYLGTSKFWLRNPPVVRYDSKKHRIKK